MVYRLEILSGVVAVYQVGSVSSPGISDLDLVVVFDPGISCLQNFPGTLRTKKKYLFAHSLYGTNEPLFVSAQRYTFFHNYELLYGRELRIMSPANSGEDKILKQQIAFEFLLKMYIAMTVQKSYRVIRLRALLLEAMAIQYDLGFLGIKNGIMFDLVNEIIAMRKTWFGIKNQGKTIVHWFERFYVELKKFLEENLRQQKFFTYLNSPINVSSNILIAQGSQLEVKRKGIAIPSITAPVLGTKHFNLNHRINNFHFTVPLKNENTPIAITARFELLKKMQDYNTRHLPHFQTLSSGLKLF